MKIDRVMLLMITLVCFLVLGGGVHRMSIAQHTEGTAEDKTEEIRQLISFLQFSLNAVGDAEVSASEKNVIINSSYSKIFRDAEVQVEDDLDPSREVVTNKNVQAYLKDVDFFFRDVTFDFQVNDIREGVTQNGQPYYRVDMNRHLQGVTVEGDTLSSVQERFVELNYNEQSRDLKIVSMYTTKLSREEELKIWWNELPTAWRLILGAEDSIAPGVYLHDIWEIGDSTIMVKGQVLPDTFGVAGKLRNIVERSTLDLSRTRRLYDLGPLNEFNNLKELDLSHTDISDLFPIRSISTLEILNCSNTKVEDLTPLRYCKSLEELYLGHTPVHDLSVLQNFERLQVLHVPHTVLDALPDLRGTPAIRELNMSNTNMHNVDSLDHLQQLEHLNMSNTIVEDIGALAGLGHLKYLEMDHTRVEDLSPLADLPLLETVSFSYTPVSDLTPLLQLASLKRVYCDESAVTREAFYAFYSRRPDIQVVFSTEQLTEYFEGLSDTWEQVIRAAAGIEGEPDREDLHEILKIRKIDVRGNEMIATIEPLEMLLNLRYLDISNTLVADLTPLARQRSLEYLDVSDSYVTFLGSLEGLKNLRVLKANGCNITDLSSLQGCASLDSLFFNSTKVREIGVLNTLPGFEAAYFDGSLVRDEDLLELNYHEDSALVVYRSDELRMWWGNLPDAWQDAFIKMEGLSSWPSSEALHRLTAKTSLSVDGIGLATLDPVVAFPRLQVLMFSDTRISSLDPVGQLSELERLECPRNPVGDLTPVAALANLTRLNIQGTSVESVEALAGLKQLKSLNCSSTEIKDLEPLSGLQQLQSLDISNTRVRNISDLDNLDALRELQCFNTRISSRKVDQFRAEHPDVDVLYY
jgi:Leucine-rich repeat (LRR) protein